MQKGFLAFAGMAQGASRRWRFGLCRGDAGRPSGAKAGAAAACPASGHQLLHLSADQLSSGYLPGNPIPLFFEKQTISPPVVFTGGAFVL